MNALYLLLSTLACWRMTHLLSKEDGPFNIIFIIRKKAGSGFFGKLLDCFYCCSVWVALPFALWVGISWQEKALCWAAISGAVCLLEQGNSNDGNTKEDIQLPDFKED